mmetsp:Transcript_63602/g.168480  ORF Transcript_63602/g.168480 Transcript_63602/m.168480 type:complete len:339 (-) Transcript_63602:1319-2335(-)
MADQCNLLTRLDIEAHSTQHLFPRIARVPKLDVLKVETSGNCCWHKLSAEPQLHGVRRGQQALRKTSQLSNAGPPERYTQGGNAPEKFSVRWDLHIVVTGNGKRPHRVSSLRKCADDTGQLLRVFHCDEVFSKSRFDLGVAVEKVADASHRLEHRSEVKNSVEDSTELPANHATEHHHDGHKFTCSHVAVVHLFGSHGKRERLTKKMQKAHAVARKACSGQASFVYCGLCAGGVRKPLRLFVLHRELPHCLDLAENLSSAGCCLLAQAARYLVRLSRDVHDNVLANGDERKWQDACKEHVNRRHGVDDVSVGDDCRQLRAKDSWNLEEVRVEFLRIAV